MRAHDLQREWSATRPAWLLLTAFLMGICGCAPQAPLRSPAPDSGEAQARPVFRAAKLQDIDAAVLAAISNRATPGAVVWLERAGTIYRKAYGNRCILPAPEIMTEETLFDAASLTKVLATTPAVMWLVERKRVNLEAPVREYLPEFTGRGREAITVRHLLTHTSGLRPGIALRPDWSGYEAGIQRALAEVPEVPVDSRVRYSDVNFILLGELVRRVAGQPLDRFCVEHLYSPLGMTNTFFRPRAELQPRIAPTTLVDNVPLRGVVHDPTSRRMDGVAGHAGLFTTAADCARFARMLLNGGQLDGRRVLSPSTVDLMTRVHTPERLVESRRGLGWDIDSPYAGPRGAHFPLGSYGHTGWTGTSLWIDPFSRTFIIMLSNRNHPTEDGNVLPLRRQLGSLAAEAVEGFNFAGVPGALPSQAQLRKGKSVQAGGSPGAVRNGIDVLVARGFELLRGKKVGLITNHTGTDRDRNSTIDLLSGASGVELRALFSPEHGIRGEQDEAVGDSVDSRTGLPVYSLYGQHRQPRAEQLAGLDVLVFDIQDIGCRFYTYISTMGLCLEAAAEKGIPFVVLDRANPINGMDVEGPVLTGTNRTFVAFHELPLRHGMTVGELARMMNAERGLKAALTVVPVEGWSRSQWLDVTGLPWINTSPNMRSLTQATLYPGVGLLEAALSVGRGTDTPFEVFGAPYIDDRRLARELNALEIPGVSFVPVRFTPKASVFKDQSCGGVQVLLLDRNACPVVDIGIGAALVLQRLYPQQFALNKLQPLLMDVRTLEAIRSGRSLVEIKAGWSTALGEFQARRGSFLLY